MPVSWKGLAAAPLVVPALFSLLLIGGSLESRSPLLGFQFLFLLGSICAVKQSA